MIQRFGANSALLIIDAQKGINASTHWGGENGHRNNPGAEDKISQLLEAWREKGGGVYFTWHDSREKGFWCVSGGKVASTGPAGACDDQADCS